ncbi:hypothetical protein BOTBODRAFT_32026 [Botryobasidium botryosum FD-172 SS1]|uniref:Deoxyhypusine hydroxylase n=1 Tax=Botryobasidium botryosum (strain FD-172 SS1) TaxID=930990 RepID=A0A067MTX6_BOTB1|nr:hypothetical protein BOTBODRAFT_32026 [Botryobasidium botryosum FD-172 SS1]
MTAAINVTPEDLISLEETLLNTSGKTLLPERFRALFTLKAIGDQRAVGIIAKGFRDSSALLKHELAYVLGQISDPSAVPVLSAVLEDKSEDPMVRHEAAEALGALSSVESIPLLKKYTTDQEQCVRETCEIALDKIEWDRSEEAKQLKKNAQFTSIDPAPPLSHSSLVSPPTSTSAPGGIDVQTLRAALLDTSLPLFKRYRAMFGLRNVGTPEAIDALCDGFADQSALFKHEIAFILGQLSHPHSIPALMKVLHATSESDMVRHEAAEALGGITMDEQDGARVLDELREWIKKPEAPEVVRQSCEIAVDMWEYENSDQFQYANGLEKAQTNSVVV